MPTPACDTRHRVGVDHKPINWVCEIHNLPSTPTTGVFSWSYRLVMLLMPDAKSCDKIFAVPFSTLPVIPDTWFGDTDHRTAGQRK
jgi:hypothetical protein